jgi:hypothetical protein
MGSLVFDADDALVTACLPPYLCYACLYWVDYVRQAGSESQCEREVRIFLENHFLHWLSLLGQFAKDIELVAQLKLLFVSWT